MEAGAQGSDRRFDHLREHSIGLPQVLFQSITHMAPAAAVAYSIYISVPDARQALPLSVGLALIACLCAATAIGQLAKHLPSAGGLYTYAARSLGPWAGLITAWLFVGFQPLVAPFLYLEFGWAMHDVFNTSIGWHWSGQWVVWVILMAAIVFLLTYRDVRLSTTAGVILGAFEIGIFARARALDPVLEDRRPERAAVQPVACGRPLERRLQGDGVRDPRVHRLRGLGAARRGGEEPASHGAAGGRRLGARDRPLLRALLVRVGLRRRLLQLRRPGDGRRPVAQPRQGLLGHRLGRRLPRDLQLDRCELERRDERRDARVLLARRGTASHRTRSAARTREFKTPSVAIIWLTGASLVISLLVGWKWNPGVGFGVIATLAVPLVVLVYMLVCVGCVLLLPDDEAHRVQPVPARPRCRSAGSCCSSSRSTTSSTRCRRRTRSSMRTGSRSRTPRSASLVTIARRDDAAGPARRPRPRLRRGRDR